MQRVAPIASFKGNLMGSYIDKNESGEEQSKLRGSKSIDAGRNLQGEEETEL